MKKSTAIAFSLVYFATFIPLFSTPLDNGGVTVNAGEDIVLCSGNTSINLNPTITGNFIDLFWEPANLFNNPTSANNSATIDNNVTLRLTVRSISDENLIQNGDFSQGNTGFTSNYVLGTGGNFGPLSSEGQYDISSNARDSHRRYAPCRDHTGGGNMMVVNASGEADNLWCQNITVETNSIYQFGAWVTTVNSENPAQLQFSINGTLLGNIFNAPFSTCQWTQFAEEWDSAENTSAEICIVNVNLTPNGNDFALDDITFRKVCETQDTVNVTVADLNAEWQSPMIICNGESSIDPNSFLPDTSTPNGSWFLDDTPIVLIEPETLSPGVYNLRYSVRLGDCSQENTQTIVVSPPPNAGTPSSSVQICEEEIQNVLLSNLLRNADPGGIWSETSVNPSIDNAFDPVEGTFNTENQVPGLYTFQYFLSGPGNCPPASATLEISIIPNPIADAGEDTSIDCDMPIVSLGGSAISTGNNFQYTWTSTNGAMIEQSDIPFPEVTEGGTYQILVTDASTGCQANDEVTVISNINEIFAEGNVQDLTCNQLNDGIITITSTTGGEGPYFFAINDGAFTDQNQFRNLAAGNYIVHVQDNNGCETSLNFELEAPVELLAEIVSDQEDNSIIVPLGDSTKLEVIFNIPVEAIDSIIWKPIAPQCSECNEIWIKPIEADVYTVTVIDQKGCVATDFINVFVEKQRRIFIPNAFSPNDDGVNDLFYINAGNDVQRISSFQVLDRWGNLVFQAQDFPANDPNFAWDGRFNGQRINTGVYVYFAEIELVDGEVIIEKGELTLMY